MDGKLTFELENEGYTHLKEVSGKGVCGIYLFFFTTGIVIGLSEFGYTGRYCYPTFTEAKEALESWNGDGDPPGEWIKYKGIGGERINPLRKSKKIKYD